MLHRKYDKNISKIYYIKIKRVAEKHNKLFSICNKKKSKLFHIINLYDKTEINSCGIISNQISTMRALFALLFP